MNNKRPPNGECGRSITLLFGGLFSSAAVEAQPVDQIAQIGHLGDRGTTPQNYAAFLQGLRDLGYVEVNLVGDGLRDLLDPKSRG